MRGIAAYKNVSLESSDQRELVIMCFEALLKRHNAAVECFDSKKFIDGVEHVRIAREILSELLLGLDHEAAPELTSSLAGLYHYCILELTKAGNAMTEEHVANSNVVVEQLYNGFKTAFSDGQGDV